MAGNALTPLLSREEYRQIYLHELGMRAKLDEYNLQANIAWSMTGDTEQEAQLQATLMQMNKSQVDAEAQQYIRALVVPQDFQWVYSRLNLDMKKWIILNYVKLAEVLTKQGQRPAPGALFLATLESMFQFFNSNSAASMADFYTSQLNSTQRQAPPAGTAAEGARNLSVQAPVSTEVPASDFGRSMLRPFSSNPDDSRLTQEQAMKLAEIMRGIPTDEEHVDAVSSKPSKFSGRNPVRTRNSEILNQSTESDSMPSLEYDYSSGRRSSNATRISHSDGSQEYVSDKGSKASKHSRTSNGTRIIHSDGSKETISDKGSGKSTASRREPDGSVIDLVSDSDTSGSSDETLASDTTYSGFSSMSESGRSKSDRSKSTKSTKPPPPPVRPPPPSYPNPNRTFNQKINDRRKQIAPGSDTESGSSAFTFSSKKSDPGTWADQAGKAFQKAHNENSTTVDRDEAFKKVYDTYVKGAATSREKKDAVDRIRDLGGKHGIRISTAKGREGIFGGRISVDEKRKKKSTRKYLSGAGAMSHGPVPADHGWQAFGKYMLARSDLENGGVFHMRYKNGQKIQALPQKILGSGVKQVLSKIADNKAPDYDDIKKLSNQEKEYVQSLLAKASLDPTQFKQSKKSPEQSNSHRFKILKGQIVAGNDSPELIKEFKHVLMRMKQAKELPPNEVNEILMELSGLGH